MKRKTTRWDVEPNPLARIVNDGIQPIVRRMYLACPILDLLGPCGITHDDNTAAGFKPSRDSECFNLTLTLLVDYKTFNCRRRLPGPIARYLRSLAKQLNKSADSIERIPDTRDLSKLMTRPKRKAGAK